MLMTVVPSEPPVVALAMTTVLKLFNLDGTRLPYATEIGNASPKNGDSYPGEGGAMSSTVVGHRERVGDKGEIVVHHTRDIRCLAASALGDMVATG